MYCTSGVADGPALDVEEEFLVDDDDTEELLEKDMLLDTELELWSRLALFGSLLLLFPSPFPPPPLPRPPMGKPLPPKGTGIGIGTGTTPPLLSVL